ncbi:MAG: DUF1566 domain-containing protein [Deltaproteobacteria bacterium]|nr:DUF1566 domain-containing protein [Deltaproteobacteria bacterium]
MAGLSAFMIFAAAFLSCSPDAVFDNPCDPASTNFSGCSAPEGAVCYADEQCADNLICADNVCVCGNAKCSGQCCRNGEVCYGDSCCASDCNGKECGDDGCGGICGSCGNKDVCFGGKCCAPDCNGKECGDDGCGGDCWTCGANQKCGDWKCACAFVNCGVDCCSQDQVCSGGKCCTPDCDGKECGGDGCGGICEEIGCIFPFQCGANECFCNYPCDVAGKLPDTGQGKCYDNGKAIACPAQGAAFSGQDAHYTTNKISFKDNGNGTVTDNVTGLIWMKCPAGLTGTGCATAIALERTWKGAIDECANSTFAGNSDWRLPSRWEIQRLADYGSFSPAINTGYFPNTPGNWFWSSSSYAPNAYGGWRVGFYDGDVGNYNKDDTCYVRCVRSGQYGTKSYKDNENGTVTDIAAGLMWQKETASGDYKWEEALEFCEDSVIAGFSDWRLPDIKELSSLIDETTSKPAIDLAYFPDTISSWYWSSTTYSPNAAGAWFAHFFDGDLDNSNKDFSLYVRCVRSGQ